MRLGKRRGWTIEEAHAAPIETRSPIDMVNDGESWSHPWAMRPAEMNAWEYLGFEIGRLRFHVQDLQKQIEAKEETR